MEELPETPEKSDATAPNKDGEDKPAIDSVRESSAIQPGENRPPTDNFEPPPESLIEHHVEYIPEHVSGTLPAVAAAVEVERVPIEAALAVGWRHLTSRILLLMGVSTVAGVVMVVPAVVYAVVKELVHRNYFLLACLIVCGVLVPQLYYLGRIKVALRFVRNEAFTSDDFVTSLPLVFHYLLMLLCRGFILTIGYGAFFFPGLYFNARFEFAEFFIIDKKQNAFRAMISSWRITKSSVMMLLLFSVTRVFIEILGLVALVVGVVPAKWMTLTAFAFVYERLSQLTDGESAHPATSALITTPTIAG